MKGSYCPWCGEPVALVKAPVCIVSSLSKPIEKPCFCPYCNRPMARAAVMPMAAFAVPVALFALLDVFLFGGRGYSRSSRQFREFLSDLFGPSWVVAVIVIHAVLLAALAVALVVAVRRARRYRLVPSGKGYQIAKIPTQLTVEVPRRLPVSGGGILPVDLPQGVSEAAEPALFFTRSVEPSSRGCYIYRCGFLGYDGVDFSRIRPGMTFTVLLGKGETVTAIVRTARAPSEDDYADERRALEPSNP